MHTSKKGVQKGSFLSKENKISFLYNNVAN